MTFVVSLPWQVSRLQSLSVKNQISSFATLLSGTEGLAGNTHASRMVLTLLVRLLGVDDGNLNCATVCRKGSSTLTLFEN